ncbi:MAG: DUF6878 family protein [Methylocella sp.]
MTESIDTTPSTDAALPDWEIKRTAPARLHDALQPGNKAALFAALAAAGVTFVVVTFDGYGDSGQMRKLTPSHSALLPSPSPATLGFRISGGSHAPLHH